jgi:hypothetical protein
MNAVLIRRSVLILALAAPAAWPQSVELADVEGTLIGGGDLNRVHYTLRVPKEANLNRTGEQKDVYSRPFNSFVSWQVQVEKTPVRTLDAAVKDSTIAGRRSKPEGSEVEGGFQVVIRPSSDDVVDAEVRTYRVAANGAIRARCSGPAKAVATLIEMCSTLQVQPAEAK